MNTLSTNDSRELGFLIVRQEIANLAQETARRIKERVRKALRKDRQTHLIPLNLRQTYPPTAPRPAGSRDVSPAPVPAHEQP